MRFLMLFLLLTGQAFAEDHILWTNLPVHEDRNLTAATYYRNIPDFYYFTIVYRSAPFYERYYSKISFTVEHAEKRHFYALKWAERRFTEARRTRQPVPQETFFRFPFNPYPEEDKENQEVYIIHPNRN